MRADRLMSLTQERLPTECGRRESVPMSAAMPMSTSLTENFVVVVETRMSQARERSRARPKEMPWRTAMTAARYMSVK